MKLSKLLKSLKVLPLKVMAPALIVALALPAAAPLLAESQVVMEGNTRSLNVTSGETNYKDSTSALVDDVVQVELWQHNREMPNTTFAKNNKVKFSVPNAQGKNQVITGTSSADNANTITDTTNVNLSMDRAKIDYIPGSAMFRYNKGAATGDKSCETGMDFPPERCYATVKISDDVINGGVNLDTYRGGPLHGCNAYHETVTIQVRVKADVISVNKLVRHQGEDANAWKTTANAKPGDNLEYMIKFKNEGNTQLNNVMVGDNMPKYNSYVSGSTMLRNGANPNGVAITNDNLTKGGVNVGNYLPGAVGYVWFKVKLDPVTAYEKCGGNYDVRNVGIVQAQGMDRYYNTAQVLINVECKDQPKTPTYSCDLLQAKTVSGRQVKFTTTASANGGATIKRYIYNFGDGTEVLKTDQASVDHTYAKDGQYASRVQVEVDVNGQTKIAESDKCAAAVSFTTPPTTPPTTPGQPGVGTTTSLPNTGAGDVVAIFLAVTVSSTVAYAVVIRRFTV